MGDRLRLGAGAAAQGGFALGPRGGDLRLDLRLTPEGKIAGALFLPLGTYGSLEEVLAEMRRLLLFTARPRNLRLRISISTPLWRTRLENRKRALFGDSPSFFLISIIDVTKLRIIYEYTNLCSSADSYSSYVFVCLHF